MIDDKFIRNKAFNYLKKYNVGSNYLKKYLEQKVLQYVSDSDATQNLHIYRTVIENEVANLLELNILNDDAYLENKIRNLIEKNNSYRLIESKLQQKYFSKEEIKKAYDKYIQSLKLENPSDGEIIPALRYMKKRSLGCFSNIDRNDEDAKYKIKIKTFRALTQRGFSGKIVKTVAEYNYDEALMILDNSAFL